MDFKIPDDARPREVGIYIAYYCLNVKSPDALAEMFHYKDRSAVDKILKKLRKRITYQSEVHVIEAKRPRQ